MRRSLFTAVLLAFTGVTPVAHAAAPGPPVTPGRTLTPIRGPVSPNAAVRKLSATISALAQPSAGTLAGYRKTLSPEMQQLVRAQPQKALRELGAQREQVLKLLGIKGRRHAGYVYYFVSTSMPTPMLRAYARDAVWDGGMLVFRGITPGHDIGWFLRNVMLRLKNTLVDGSSPTVTLDPNLYSVYGIDVAPTIVYTTQRPWTTCDKTVAAHLVAGGRLITYRRCAHSDPSTYWSIEGAVSTWYALSQFRDAGAPHVRALMRAMRAGRLNGVGKKQAGITQPAPGPGNVGNLLRMMNGSSANRDAGTRQLIGQNLNR